MSRLLYLSTMFTTDCLHEEPDRNGSAYEGPVFVIYTFKR